MDENNPPSLYLEADSLLTSTKSNKSGRESPSSLSPASTPHQRPHTHAYASHFLLPLPSPPFSRPSYFLCIHEISINEKLSRKFCHYALSIRFRVGIFFLCDPLSASRERLKMQDCFCRTTLSWWRASYRSQLEADTIKSYRAEYFTKQLRRNQEEKTKNMNRSHPSCCVLISKAARIVLVRVFFEEARLSWSFAAADCQPQ